MRTPALIFIEKEKTATGFYEDGGFRFDSCLEACVQRVLDGGFRNCSNLETGVPKILDVSFQKYFQSRNLNSKQ